MPRKYSKSNQVIVDTFYGKLHKDYPRARHIAMAHVTELVAPYIPAGTIPIGDDGGGDLFLLGLKGKHRSQVLIYDHEARGASKRAPASDLPDDIYLLADSLEDFFGKLTAK